MLNQKQSNIVDSQKENSMKELLENAKDNLFPKHIVVGEIRDKTILEDLIKAINAKNAQFIRAGRTGNGKEIQCTTELNN